MKNRALLAAAVVALAVGLIYVLRQPAGVDADGAAKRPPTPPPAATSPGPVAAPTPPATALVDAIAAYDPPASVSLDNGPPPLKLYRCAVYARLLSEKKTGAEAAAFRTAADELDAVIALVRDTQPPAANPASGDATTAASAPDPESVRTAELAKAEQTGPRLVPWLEESYARCDQELAWAHDVWGHQPASPAPGH